MEFEENIKKQKKYKKKILWKNIFYSWYSIIFFIIIIFFLISNFSSTYKIYIKTKIDLDLNKKLEIEKQDKLTENQKKLAEIKTDYGVEKYIRNKYSVKKEGEELVNVYDSPKSTSEIPKSKSWYKNLIFYILNLFNF